MSDFLRLAELCRGHTVFLQTHNFPDPDAIASAYGVPSMTLRDEAKVEETLDRFLATEGPCLLIAEVSPEWKTTD